MRIPNLMLIVVALLVHPLRAEDEPAAKSNQTKAVSDHWLGVSRDYAKAFTIAPVDPEAKPFALYEKPVFHHTQSVRGDDIGAVHLWITPDKRPAVIGVVFAWTNSPTTRMCSYEFHSLSPKPLTLTHEQQAIWTSNVPGFAWKEFSGKQTPPAAGKLQQRLQMNRMARKFTANTTTKQEERWELRLVPTPIYQYDSKEAGITHGAMYVFCQGTDTEVILLIEAYNASDSATVADRRWRYTIVPFTDYKAVVKYGKEEVWVSADGQLNENGKPHYWSFLGSAPKPAVEIEGE